jgi:acetamidase/formamidase
MSTVTICGSQKHLKWSSSIPPVHRCQSGGVVTFQTIDGSNGQITTHSTVKDLHSFDLAQADPVFGPVYVEEAEIGDVLEVELVDLKPANWGWTCIFPGFGLLADDFPDTYELKLWDLSNGTTAVFKPGIEIPIRPFMGTIGIAPPEGVELPMIPPHESGGNVDCKYLTSGTKLYLPVKARGALFSCGDGHAAQGDGEVCGTAIETPMTVSVKLTVHKDKPYVTSPQYLSCPSSHPDILASKGYYSVLGIDSSLVEASKKALRGMLEYLVKEHLLSRIEAYMLCSVTADLQIVEAVDMPNYAVACRLPLAIFTLGLPI